MIYFGWITKNGHEMPKDRHEMLIINMSRYNPKISHLTMSTSCIYLYIIVYIQDDIPKVLTTQACLMSIVIIATRTNPTTFFHVSTLL